MFSLQRYISHRLRPRRELLREGEGGGTYILHERTLFPPDYRERLSGFNRTNESPLPLALYCIFSSQMYHLMKQKVEEKPFSSSLNIYQEAAVQWGGGQVTPVWNTIERKKEGYFIKISL